MSIVIDDLKKSYGKIEVLKGINFEFKDHNKYLIKATNGAGKSTLIKAILNQIHYTGNIISNSRISYCPECSLLLSFMSLETFIKTFSTLTDSIENIDSKIDYYLEYFEILKYKKCYLGSLSKGQRQKANIIQSILSPSDCVIMDEPLSGLDQDSRIKLVKLIEEDNRMYIIISHEVDLFTQDKFSYIGIENGRIKVLSKIH